jgi:hypothetical protein
MLESYPTPVLLQLRPWRPQDRPPLARRADDSEWQADQAVDLSGKRLDLLKQVVPGLSRVALLTDTKTDSVRERTIKAYQAAAATLGITLWPVLSSALCPTKRVSRARIRRL